MYLEIENFGQHDLLTLDVPTGEVMFVVGKNRVGKTTIRDAIEFALLGTCSIRGFTTKKDLSAYMVARSGGQQAAKMRVTFRWKDLGVQRSLTPNGGHKIAVFRNGTYIEANAAEYAEYLGPLLSANKGLALRVALDCETFFRLSEEDRRKLLIGVKDVEGVTGDDVWEAIGVALTTYADEDEARQGRLRGLCESAALGSFKAANSQAVEIRRERKRDLADIDAKLEADPLAPEINGIDATRGTPAEQAERLAALRVEFEQAIAARAAGSGNVEAKIEEARRQLAQAETVRDELPPVLVDVDGTGYGKDKLREMKQAAQTAVSEGKDRLREASETHDQLVEDLAELRGRIDATKEAPEHPGNCPAMQFEMKCRVKPATFEKAWKESGGGDVEGAALEKRKTELEAEVGAAKAEVQTLHEDVAKIAARSEMLSNAFIEAGQRLTRFESACEAVAEIERRITELEVEVDAVPENVPTEDDVLALRNRIETGEQVIAHRTAFDEDKAERERLQTLRNEVDLDVKWWDEIEKAFRPDGVERKMADLATSHFSVALEESDDLAAVRIEESMELSINGQHIASCSESEALCGGYALQAAMSRHLGLGFLVVDRLDKLDVGWKRQFQSWAGDGRTSWQSGVIALATSDADPPGTPPDGFRTVWLRDGERPLLLGGGMD